MADFNVKIRAKELGKDLENLAVEVEQELNQAVSDLANAAFANIMAKAQEDLETSRADYIKGLKFDKVGENAYLISLDGRWPNLLEEGFPPYDVRETALQSKKIVEVGTRAGQPWVQVGKKGQKYAHIPFEHKPFSKAAKTADLSAAIREMKAYNKSGRKQKLTSIFKDEFGRPMQGKVARVESDIPQLENLTKFQKVYADEATGKSSVQSVYMTWRTISENGEPWNHPGYNGLRAFQEAEDFVEQQIDLILETLVK